MKIAPINNIACRSFCANPAASKKKHPVDDFSQERYIQIPLESLQAYYLNGTQKTSDFKYKSVSSTLPLYAPLDCDYRDVDEFSRLYARKINSQLMKISLNDVKSLASRIRSKTNAPKEQIYQVLNILTQYSNYDSLDKFQELIDEYDIKKFGCDFDNLGSFSADCSSGSVLNYLAQEKKQLDIKTKHFKKKFAIPLDDQTLNLIESYKNSRNRVDKLNFRKLKTEMALGNVIFLNLPAWDVKCSDGKYRNANFLSGSGYLEDLAVDVISRLNQGESLKDIAYGDFEERLSEIFGDSHNINVKKVPPVFKKPDAYSVYRNLKVNGVSSTEIQMKIAKYFKDVPLDKMAQYLKYCDEVTYVFSPDSFARSLINLHKKLGAEINKTQYSPDEALYSIPCNNKSFVYIANVYSKLNEIPQDRLIGSMRFRDWCSNPESELPKIILDDISASGETQKEQCSKVRDTTLNSNVYSACILSSKSANALNSKTNNVSVFEFDDFKSAKCHGKQRIKKDERINPTGKVGYKVISSAGAFPYMIPDSNSEFISDVFSGLLHNNNPYANKGLVFRDRRNFLEKLFGS